jgi:hypothetical protein
MPKPKVILLPATEELLNLYKGKVKWRTKQRFKIFAWIDFIKDRITITEIKFFLSQLANILLIPFFVLITIPHVIIGNAIKLLKGKEHGEKWFDGFRDFMSSTFFEKKDNIHNRMFFIRANRKISEDVPGFLAESKRHGFERVVYIKHNENYLIPKIETLIQRGWISKYISYENIYELKEYIEHEDLNTNNSWVIYSLPGRKDIPENIIKEEWTNQFYLLKNLEFNYASRKFGQSFSECGKGIMFSRVKLNYFSLFQPDVVLYFEREFQPAVNACITSRIDELRATFADKKMKLVYFPSLNNLDEPPARLMDMLMYSQPDLFSGDDALSPQQIFNWLSNIKLKELYNLLGEMLDIPYQPEACFIRCLYEMHNTDNPKLGLYTLYPIYGTDERKVSQEIDFYLTLLQHAPQHIHYSLSREDPSKADADKWFFTEGQKISDEVKLKIAEIKQFTAEETILETLFYIIKSFRESKPELCRQLCLQLYEEMDTVNRKTSRLYIDKHFRIFLPDYNNIEIELTPLPKTLYLFLLKYPDGVFFKELYMHKRELLDIYGRIGNRTDLEQMQKSINDMTDARANSVNEKCSRIKEAFLTKLDERLAYQYIVTGNRQDAKCISLDRALVVFEEPI